MSDIDLRDVKEGLAIFKDGSMLWSLIYGSDQEGVYNIRIEHGWYNEYNYKGQRVGYGGATINNDGTRLVHPTSPENDLADFIPCDYSEGLKLMENGIK